MLFPRTVTISERMLSGTESVVPTAGLDISALARSTCPVRTLGNQAVAESASTDNRLGWWDRPNTAAVMSRPTATVTGHIHRHRPVDGSVPVDKVLFGNH